jgi:signal transduction histidine kinase
MAFLYGGYLAGTLTIMAFILFSILSPSFTWYMQVHAIIPALAILLQFFLKSWKYYSVHTKSIFYVVLAAIAGILHSTSSILLNINRNLPDGWTNHLQQAFWSGIIFIGSTLFLFYIIEVLCGIDQLQQNFKKMKKLYHINMLADEASKEFHKPLTMIKGFTHLLGAEQNKANKEYVPIILEELQRAERIINSYLNLAKADMFPSRTISSKELLEYVLAGLYTYANNQNVQIKTKHMRNLRIKGNMEMLVESLTNILKHCIDSNGGAINRIHLNHFLQRNEVVFEILLNSKGFEAEPVKSFLHLPAMHDKAENSALYTAYTTFLAHGGDIQIRTRMFKNILVLTLPAQMKKSEYASRKVIRTN